MQLQSESLETLPRAARFGDFVLAPARRRLLRQGEPVRLSDRALDLLVVLVQRRGEVVAKQQLLTLAWPGVVVEESNLRVQVAALRRALDDPSAAPRYVASVPGRGYAFVADVAWEPDAGEASAAPPAPARTGAADAPPAPRLPLSLPPSARPLVGRDDLVSAVQYELALRRLITLTGPGGIGKTAVARAVGARVGRAYADGVQLLDLSALSHGSLVLPHLASRLRLPAGPSALGAVVEHLRARHLLLILDNCEHVVEAVCALAQEVLAQCPGVDLLATSREALRVGGEYVKRLQPLGVPPESETLSRETALEFPALRLLAERIEAQDVRLVFDAAELALLADLCRRLDGLPLALELAATWVPVLGLPGVSALLDQRLSRLGRGARDAQPRHRTLAAAIDWSYDTLPADEQALFRQLGAFSAPFTLEAVEAVCRLRGGEAAGPRALELLGRLVDQSLVSVELTDQPPRYRLFESLRRYALEKLTDAGELRAAREAHARHVLAHCRGAAVEHLALPSADWLRRHGGEVADIRAALDWAFAPQGDARLGIALVVASAPFWFRLLLVAELQGRLWQAIERAREIALDDDAALLRLHLALAHALFHTGGPAQEVAAVLRVALAHARAAGDAKAQLETLWALFGNDSTWGDYAAAWDSVEQVRALAQAPQGHPAAQPLYRRIAALGCHLRGEQDAALAHARAALAPGAVQRCGEHGRSLVYDHRTAVGSHQARALWLRGFADQAAEVVRETEANARRIDQPFALGYFLVSSACPVALWRGDHGAAWHAVELLLDVAAGISFNVWRSAGQFYGRVLRVLERTVAGRAAGTDGLPEDLFGGAEPTPQQAQLLATFDARLLSPVLWERLDADVRTGAPHWATAELLRVRGERLRREGGAAQEEAAAALFEQALALARQQQARAWALRAACSLARLRQAQGRAVEARAPLAAAYGAFTEGFETRDLVEARVLLEALGA